MAKVYLENGVEKTREELFNAQELAQIDRNQELINAAGYGEIDLTLLTVLEREISKQKFYTVNPEDFIPVDHTTGGFADYITVLRSFINADADISTWERGNDTDNARRNQVGAKVESVSLKVHNLDKMVSYSLFELRQAMQTGIWNIVTEKERARKIDYDLSVQRALLAGDSKHKGLLNQTGATTNTTTLTKNISAMTSAEFKAFMAAIFKDYFGNTNSTALPDTFVIPMEDFLGMGVAVDEQYPLVSSMLDRFTNVFREVTGNANAVIKPLVYCDKAKNGGTAKYALYRKDWDTLRAYQPVDYTVVQGATVDGMNYQNTAYARVSDVFLNRPAELMYFTHD